MGADIEKTEKLERQLAKVVRERDRLMRELIAARQQNEYMLATLRKLYDDVRAEQSRPIDDDDDGEPARSA